MPHWRPRLYGMRTVFDPTSAPPGRLARLGVVFSSRTPAAAIPALARMCERAGIDAVWVAKGLGPDGDEAEDRGFDPVAIVQGLRTGLARIALGVLVPPSSVAETLRALVGRAGVDRPSHRPNRRIEVGIVDDGRPSGAADTLRTATSIAAREGLGAPTDLGLRPRLSAAVTDTDSIRPLLAVVDDIILPGWRFDDLESAADEARAQAAESARDAATLGVAALLPISIGRTQAEAAARAQMDDGFAAFGDPELVGILGALEECQDRVIALAHAGVSDLRCLLPATGDVHDVIAQLTAITMGTTDVLRPGSLRSPAPPPPDGWGGRPDRPTEPRVSGGSRRR